MFLFQKNKIILLKKTFYFYKEFKEDKVLLKNIKNICIFEIFFFLEIYSLLFKFS